MVENSDSVKDLLYQFKGLSVQWGTQGTGTASKLIERRIDLINQMKAIYEKIIELPDQDPFAKQVYQSRLNYILDAINLMEKMHSKSMEIVNDHKIEDDEMVITMVKNKRNIERVFIYQSQEEVGFRFDPYSSLGEIDDLLIPDISVLGSQYRDAHENNVYSEKRCELRVINWFFNWWRILWMFLSYQLGCRIYEIPNFTEVLESKESDMRALLARIGKGCTLDRNGLPMGGGCTGCTT